MFKQKQKLSVWKFIPLLNIAFTSLISSDFADILYTLRASDSERLKSWYMQQIDKFCMLNKISSFPYSNV